MADFQCPAPTCDWHISLAIESDSPLLVIAKREASDSRFRIYASAGGVFEELMLLHTCGDGGGGAGDREPREPEPHQPWHVMTAEGSTPD